MKNAITCLLLTVGFADESCQNASEEVSMMQLNRMRDSVDIDRLFDDLIENPSNTAAMISQFNEDKRDALLQRAAEPIQWTQLVQKFRDLPDTSKTNLIKHGEISQEMGVIFNSLPETYQTHALELIQEYDVEKASELEHAIGSKGGGGGGGNVGNSFGSKGGKKKTTTTTTTPSAQSKLVSKVKKDSSAASTVLNAFKSASSITKQLELLVKSVKNAKTATSSADTAVKSFSSKLVSITNDIASNKQEALWDGAWDAKDLEVFVKQGIDIFLKIVKTFLLMTIDLGTLADAFDAILVILKQVVELAVSVTELIQAVGSGNIDKIQSLSGQATSVIDQCSDEVKKITKAEKGLKPILEKWHKSSTVGRATVVAANLGPLKQGFDDLGAAWISVGSFFDSKVKPLLSQITTVVGQLQTQLSGYTIPVNPGIVPVPSIPWPKVGINLLR